MDTLAPRVSLAAPFLRSLLSCWATSSLPFTSLLGSHPVRAVSCKPGPGPRAPSPCFSPTFAHTTVLGSVFRNWTPCAQSHTLLVGARTSCFASLRLGSTPSVKWGCCCSRLRKAATAENSVGTTRSLPLLIASSLLTLSPRHQSGELQEDWRCWI